MPAQTNIKESRFLDTNFFLRYFLDDIPEQTEIVENILRKGQERSMNLVLSLDTVIDINNVLEFAYEVDKNERLIILNKLMEMTFLKYPSKDLEAQTKKAVDFYNQYNLDFQDCVALAACIHYDYTLFSFDVKLKKTAKELGLKRIP